MPDASGECLWAGSGRGTRRHHEADEQLSGTEAQHPSQPVPATHNIDKVLIRQHCTNGDGIKNGVFPAADDEILHEWMVKGLFNPPKV